MAREIRPPQLSKKVRRAVNAIALTGLALLTLFFFLLPMGYGAVTSLKTDEQIAKAGAPPWPATERKYTYEGKDYDVLLVPTENGEIRELAIIKKGRTQSTFVDLANPIQIFFKIILPQAVPALTAVTLFHFFYSWNDFFGPLIYLVGNPDKFPITVGLTAFNNLYTQKTNLIQAASLVSAVIPVIVFFFAQRIFMQGVVITGVEK